MTRKRQGRRALAPVVLTAMGLMAFGCASAPPPAPPSILEQCVDAMDREDWDRAHHLMGLIVEPLPSEKDGDASVAFQDS